RHYRRAADIRRDRVSRSARKRRLNMAAHTLIPDIVHDVPVTDEMIQYAEVYRAIVALAPNPLPHVTYAQAERIAMLEAQNKSQAALMGDLMRENGALLA